MKNAQKFMTFLFVAFCFTACQEKISDKQAEYKTTMDEVLVMHDSLMTKMGPINKNIQKLKDREGIDQGKKEKLIANLEKSHDKMMTWMQEFGKSFPNALDEKKLSEKQLKKKLPAIKDEKRKMQDIKEMTQESLKEARDVLKNK